MSVASGHGQLNDAMKLLRRQWEQSRAQWKDAAASDFEKEYWNTLEGSVKSTMSALDRLAEVLAAVRRDCSVEGDSETC